VKGNLISFFYINVKEEHIIFYLVNSASSK